MAEIRERLEREVRRLRDHSMDEWSCDAMASRLEATIDSLFYPHPEAREEAKELAWKIFDGIAIRVDQFFKAKNIQGGVRCGDDMFSIVDKLELAKSIEAYALSRLAAQKGEGHSCRDCQSYDCYEGESCEHPERGQCIDHSLFEPRDPAAPEPCPAEEKSK